MCDNSPTSFFPFSCTSFFINLSMCLLCLVLSRAYALVLFWEPHEKVQFSFLLSDESSIEAANVVNQQSHVLVLHSLCNLPPCSYA